MAVTTFAARFRTAAWLGWQIESNWADLLTFTVYSVLRPLGTALILAGMYWAVAHTASRRAMFPGLYVANAFHEYVVRILIGMGWMVVEEPGRLTLALIQGGMWIAIRSRRADNAWRNVLPEILERESAFLGLAEPVTRVIVCAQHEFDTEMHDAWRAEAIAYRELALAAE